MSNRLLEVLSTRSMMTFGEFNKAVDLFRYGMQESDASEVRRRIARYLEELGHCEFDYSRRRVVCCKPNIAILPGPGCFSAVLTGARIPAMVNGLLRFQRQYKDRLLVDITAQQGGGFPLPDVITVITAEKDLLFHAARTVGVGCQDGVPAAWLLLHASGSLEEYYNQLTYQVSGTNSLVRREFSVRHLCFQRADKPEGDGLMEFTDPITHKKIHIWRDSDKSVEVDRDWGRYLSLKYNKTSILLFDKIKQVLAVPSYVPMPKIIARAVTLCSGRAARKDWTITETGMVPARTPVDIYHGVPEQIAIIAAKKLGQELHIFDSNLAGEGNRHD